MHQISQKKGTSVVQKRQTLLIDDLNSSKADGTVRFGLDGTEYEIDLNAEHAQAMRTAGALCERGPRRERCPAASPERMQGAGERAEYHRGSRVAEGAGYRR